MYIYAKPITCTLDDETLRQELGIQGRVAFYDRANPAATLLENGLEQMDPQDVRPPQRLPDTRHRKGRGKGKGASQGQKRAGTTRRRNRRADQFCVHIVANEHHAAQHPS
ncbi:unnamed protein product [Penicillium camemberti]|uniref:Str. FM013 n=1 Tax=Penicillium camemberti (strain FM 013) TaxID=1429867 RepID=A0A0G4NZN5_PENC3|nr:unnamed protein product [Penicillium camemberti]